MEPKEHGDARISNSDNNYTYYASFYFSPGPRLWASVTITFFLSRLLFGLQRTYKWKWSCEERTMMGTAGFDPFLFSFNRFNPH